MNFVIQRSVAEGEVNETKTEASQAALPLDPDLAESLLAHKARSLHLGESDYVFVRPDGTPPWPDSILADHLQPVAKAAGIRKIGWHTFRHTYSTLLHALGSTPAIQEELLHHANIQTTLNFYPQAVSEAGREAASKVVGVSWTNRTNRKTKLYLSEMEKPVLCYL